MKKRKVIHMIYFAGVGHASPNHIIIYRERVIKTTTYFKTGVNHQAVNDNL